jgi:hypothetical protein
MPLQEFVGVKIVLKISSLKILNKNALHTVQHGFILWVPVPLLSGKFSVRSIQLLNQKLQKSQVAHPTWIKRKWTSIPCKL